MYSVYEFFLQINETCRFFVKLVTPSNMLKHVYVYKPEKKITDTTVQEVLIYS